LINGNKNNLKKKIFRKIEDEPPVPLNIYLDLYNFNSSISDSLKDKLKNFIESMYKAKNLLEKMLLIDRDISSTLKMDDVYKEFWGISSWNTTMFIHDEIINVEFFNYFIFFKFLPLNNVDMTSKIVLTYTNNIPLMGLITINENIDISKVTLDYLTPLFLQQFIKLLGFQINYENDEVDFAGPIFAEIEEEEDDDDDNNNDNNAGDDEGDEGDEDDEKTTFTPLENLKVLKVYINSETIINYIKDYFDCHEEIEKIDLEIDEYNNVYWPSRKFLGDIMTKFDDYKEKVLSRFTLSVLENTGYLYVKENSYFTGGLMRFGKHKGCKFLNEDCGADNIDELVFSNEFYLPTETTADNPIPSCSSNRLGKTIYVLHQVDSSLTEINYEYRLNGLLTGLKQTNYCPFAEYETSSTGFCSDSNIAKNDAKYEETGSDSFCVLSSLITNTFTSVCYKMICSSRSLTIKVGEKYIVCPRSGGRLKPRDIEGYILCPDYNLICTGNENKICNNYMDCINKGISEKEDNYDYDIKTNQRYELNEGEELKLVIGWEESDDGFCPKYCKQCGSEPDKKCDECAPGYKIYNEADNQCLEIVPNCEEYENNWVCKTCKEGFFLAEEDNFTLICEETSTRSEFYYPLEGANYKVKCKNKFDNCYTCDTTQAKCLLCLENYGLLDGGSKCIDKSSTLYYENGEVYKLCSEYTPEQNCQKCQITEEGDYKCLECKENYGYVHEDEETASCRLISSLPSQKYFTEDTKNYYKCENNDIENCNQCERKDKCLGCKDGYTVANDGQVCISSTDIANKLYYNDPTGSSFYYLCKTSLNNCLKCDSKTKCTECDSSTQEHKLDENDKCIPQSDIDAKLYYEISVTNRYASCSKISNCEKCTSAENCISCKIGFNLVEGDDNKITCQNIELNNYYKKTTTDKEYYRKCSKDIENCNKCTDSTHCTECKENYAIVEDDYQFCRDLSSGKYYYNNEKYKLCSNGFANCELCLMEDSNLKCTKCFTGYSFKHDTIIECIEQSTLLSLEESNTFYSNDSRINFYSCSNHNEVKNCNKCNNSKTCEECNTGYDLENKGTLCASQVDKGNNMYAYNPAGELMPCHSLIPNCNSCENNEKCLTCQEGSGLIGANNTCVSENLIEQEHIFYKDETTGNYISCSIIDNCITCSSSTTCTSCQNGFKINSNNICEKINDSDDDSGLSTGAIIGIVIGCVAFLALIALLVYYLYNKFFAKSNNTIEVKPQKTDGIIVNEEEKQEKQEEPEKEGGTDEKTLPAHTTKRSIHN